MEVGGQRHAPATLPPGKTRSPLYRRLGGPHGCSGQVRKIPLPLEFDPQTIQPVASCYTDWAIAAHFKHKTVHKVHEADNSKGDTPSQNLRESHNLFCGWDC
jgi:hypothetical protein